MFVMTDADSAGTWYTEDNGDTWTKILIEHGDMVFGANRTVLSGRVALFY
jgi:hypothetical protein